MYFLAPSQAFTAWSTLSILRTCKVLIVEEYSQHSGLFGRIGANITKRSYERLLDFAPQRRPCSSFELCIAESEPLALFMTLPDLVKVDDIDSFLTECKLIVSILRQVEPTGVEEHLHPR